MGGKKKSLANKLAKMSDEERARYLQHKADIEEEAKRRKEQLIATFLKKKIKREEMFSRLNLAKINQHWHHILRMAKCQEMKENVEHMKTWIERLIDYKNRTIMILMEELEEAEDQYVNNFQSHTTYIDNIIERQDKHIKKMQDQYDEDLRQLLEASEAEKDGILKNANSEREYLHTVLYGQETLGKRNLKATYEYYKQKEYETECFLNDKMKALTESREAVNDAICRQISTVTDLHEQQLDSTKLHLAKLEKMDADSAVEIRENGERMRRQEDLLDHLKSQYQVVIRDLDPTIKACKNELKGTNFQFLKVKQGLQKELQIDEKKIIFLADTCGKTWQHLENINQKGDHITNLASTCEKLKTQREIISKWLPVSLVGNLIKDDEDLTSGEALEVDLIITDSVLQKEECPEDSVVAKAYKLRPKTAITGRTTESGRENVTTPNSRRTTTLKKVAIQARHSEKSPPSSLTTSSLEASPIVTPDILDRCKASLRGMENFWFVFNKTDVDFADLKEEKRNLEKENKQLRGMIRAVLETAALARSIPNSRVSTRVPSKIRNAQSAPLRRIIFA